MLADENWIAGLPPLPRPPARAVRAAPASSRDIAFETDNFVAVEGLVAQGIGVATLPRMAVAVVPAAARRRHAARCRTPRRARIHVVTAHGAERVPADPRHAGGAIARLASLPRTGGARHPAPRLDDDVCLTRSPHHDRHPAPTCACASARRPTGLPHVGLIRTVLFNWAYARHNGGKLVFRIEDTDAARDSEESYRQLLDALRWLKIDWDEGVEVGGPHAPYRQSQRHDIYREVLDKLIAAGAVYESYSTAEEIDARNEANGRAKQLGYDNFDRDLTDEQKAAFRAEGREPAWRLRVPDDDLTYVDLIRGEVTFPAGSFPDFVLVRAGGVPLYPFVNPVDDALMGITHVIRGEDLMPSTARQLALYSALVDAGRDDLHPALRAHAARARRDRQQEALQARPQGRSLPPAREGLHPRGSAQLPVAARLVDRARPRRLLARRARRGVRHRRRQPEPGPLRPEEGRVDQRRPHPDAGARRFRRAHRPVPRTSAGSSTRRRPPAQQAIIDAAAPLVQERMQLLGEVPGLLGFLFRDEVVYDEDALASLPGQRRRGARRLGRRRSSSSPESEFTAAAVQEALVGALIEGLGLKPRVAYGPLRVAVSGRRISPPLFESMELLGKAESIRRLGALVESRRAEPPRFGGGRSRRLDLIFGTASARAPWGMV